MRVLYNGLCINGKLSGVQYYAWQLMCRGLAASGNELAFHPLLSRNICECDYYIPHPSNILVQGDCTNRLQRIILENSTLPTLFRRTASDLLHCPAYILPPLFRGKSVVTVHDTIALDYPAYCKTANAFYFRMLLERSIRKADHIIAVSESVASDIKRLFPDSPTPVTVICPGVDPLFRPVENRMVKQALRRKYALPDRFVLYVGTIEPKKNLLNLLRAFKIYRQQGGDAALVLVGQWGWKYGQVARFLQEEETSRQVILLDYVAREELPALYSMADLFLFPSFIEGFGFPPLEAMACGTPVLMSGRGALAENASADCRFFDPESPSGIAESLEAALRDTAWRQRSRISGPDHAAAYSWERAWAQTLGVYHSIV